MKLADFGYDVYSQSGEDGIIEKIFELIKPQSRLCVEFGAHNGIYVSNTANLWRNGWRSILIEADENLYQTLMKNTEDYDCLCLHEFVESTGEQSLDKILQRQHVTETIDLLSIDIDGNDYYIFEGLQSLRPRVIVCEYNPTIPIHIDLVAPLYNYFGASARSLIRLAESKDYRLVAITKSNCFFVVEEEYSKFVDFELVPEQIMVNDNIIYLMTTYDGYYVLSKKPPYGIKNVYPQPLVGEYFTPPEQEIREPSLRFLLKKKLARLLKR